MAAKVTKADVAALLASGATVSTSVGVNLAALGLSPTVGDTEKEFEAAVEREARRLGWLAYHTRDSRKSASGFPDLVMLRAGRLVVAELKVGDNRPSAAQETWLEEFGKVRTAEVFVWRPESWPEILKTLT